MNKLQQAQYDAMEFLGKTLNDPNDVWSCLCGMVACFASAYGFTKERTLTDVAVMMDVYDKETSMTSDEEKQVVEKAEEFFKFLESSEVNKEKKSHLLARMFRDAVSKMNKEEDKCDACVCGDGSMCGEVEDAIVD